MWLRRRKVVTDPKVWPPTSMDLHCENFDFRAIIQRYKASELFFSHGNDNFLPFLLFQQMIELRS